MTVSELEDVGIIQEIMIKKQKNQHSICEVKLYTSNENKLIELKRKIGKSVCIEDDTKIYMRGTIRAITCKRTYSGLKTVIKIISYSDKLDQEKKNRVFQNTQKKYKEVFEVLNSKEGTFKIIDSSFSTINEPLLLVQSNQTDYEFAYNLANNYNYSLFINDTNTKCSINIGKNNGNAKQKLVEEDIITCNILLDDYTEQLSIRIRKFLEVGQIVSFENQDYVITSAIIVYKNDTLSLEYTLEKEIKVETHREALVAQLGKAKVISNQDPEHLGRIQVSFIEFENCLDTHIMWIPYIPCLTEQDQGVIFIPNVNEIVYVFCLNGQCYANGCIRETQLNDKIKNVENRTLMFKDKFISFLEDKIEMEAFSYKTTMQENRLILENKGNIIKLEEGNIIVQYGDSKINITNDTIQLLTNQNVDIKANAINLNGTKEITAKTKSFDIG